MKTTDTIVAKPWGSERIFAANGRYAGKLISIKAGETLSFQYHQLKEETIHVLTGILGMETESEGVRVVLSLEPGETFHVTPGTRHRMFAGAGDVLVVEVSSPELDDVVRLEDRYGREGTSQP
ncbi:cupin domain-containing protein [bacterium]|nr:cupin domain-containing protein [bacterium]